MTPCRPRTAEECPRGGVREPCNTMSCRGSSRALREPEETAVRVARLPSSIACRNSRSADSSRPELDAHLVVSLEAGSRCPPLPISKAHGDWIGVHVHERMWCVETVGGSASSAVLRCGYLGLLKQLAIEICLAARAWLEPLGREIAILELNPHEDGQESRSGDYFTRFAQMKVSNR
jgi:hypothetical protein